MRRKAVRRIGILFAQVLLVATVVAAWQLSAENSLVNPVYTGRPSQILPKLLDGITGQYWSYAGTTIFEALMAFVIGSGLGIGVGIVLGTSEFLNSVASPFVVALNSMPRIALAPLYIVWFGLGSESRIALGVSMVFFVALVNTLAGILSADRDHLLLAKVLGARRLTTFRTFVLPSAMPSIFAGLKLGLVYSFLAAVVGEMFGGSAGLGGQLSLATNTFEMDDFFAELLFLVFLTLIASHVLIYAERRVLRWKSV